MTAWSSGTEAVITPLTPPITKIKMKPSTYHIGVVSFGFPVTKVARYAKTWIPDGIATRKLVNETKLSAKDGRPVENMWCTHTPNPMNAVAISARTTHV